MSNEAAQQVFRQVMMTDPVIPTTPFQLALRDFVFGEVWSRPGLSRRDRRLVALSCAAAADAPQPIADQVYAALNSGDLDLTAMLELVLHFAVYCGWPKASHLEAEVARQGARIAQENGEPPPAWPTLADDTLGSNDWEQRIARGVKEFVDVNLLPAPAPTSPYRQAGILSFVFGHVWQRPGLTRRERRIITVACVALDDSPGPLQSHTTSALHSGDLTKEEMDEIVLQFSVYYGFAKGEALSEAVEAAWEKQAAG